MKMLAAPFAATMLALSLTAAVRADEPAVTAAQIEAAKTPSDHAALASAYDKEAKRLEASASQHQAMAKAYQAAAPTQKGMNGASMAAHCKKLADAYATAATENRALATEHKAMAK